MSKPPGWLTPTLLVLTLVACLSSPARAQSGTEIRMGYNPVWSIPFLLIGKERGAFETPPGQVKWVTFVNPNQVIEAMAAGELDAGGITPAHYLIALDKGLKMTAVAILSGWSKPTASYMVRIDSGIQTAQDLRGKTIGVNNYGGVFDIYLRQMLDKNGVDPKKDVKIVEVPIANIYQALSTKQIDAGAVPVLFVPLAETKFKGQFKILFDFADVPGIKERPQINQLILAVTDDYVKKHRPALKAFLRRYLDVVRWGYANPAEATALWAKASKVDLVKALPDPFGPNTDAKIDVPALQLDIEIMHRYGYLKKIEFGARPLVDHSILDEILAGR
jgi:ABC-type nitrate/sulfonate/bicarbonate transport system substrate-binding protein